LKWGRNLGDGGESTDRNISRRQRLSLPSLTPRKQSQKSWGSFISCQRFFKRILEKEIFDVVLTQAGYDPVQAQIRLNWGVPDKPEIIVADIMKAAEDNLISRDEFRSIVRELGWKLEEIEQAQK